MSRKKHKYAPDWAYEDNPLSKFGMIYVDYLKSRQYQALSCGARQFLTVCIVNASSEKAKECLFNALADYYRALGIEKSKEDLNREVYENSPLFVIPKAQYEQYGYTKSYVYKYLKELKEHGFIKDRFNGKNSRKVNVYEFSTEWKKK